jgi:hypothetical protein
MDVNLVSGATKLLLAFSTTHIDVYDLLSTQWVQTINLKSTKPLQTHGEGSLLCLSSAYDLPLLVNLVPSGRHDLLLKVSGEQTKAFQLAGTSGGAAQRLIGSISSSAVDLPKKNQRIQISAPSDFSHISHLGPGAGPFATNLIDLSSNMTVTSQHSLAPSDGSTLGRGRRDSNSSSQSQSSASPYKYN